MVYLEIAQVKKNHKHKTRNRIKQFLIFQRLVLTIDFLFSSTIVESTTFKPE